MMTSSASFWPAWTVTARCQSQIWKTTATSGAPIQWSIFDGANPLAVNVGLLRFLPHLWREGTLLRAVLPFRFANSGAVMRIKQRRTLMVTLIKTRDCWEQEAAQSHMAKWARSKEKMEPIEWATLDGGVQVSLNGMANLWRHGMGYLWGSWPRSSGTF